MSEVVGTLSFSVQGEFITQMAREMLFYDNKPYEKAEELLLACMGGTDKSELELKYMAQDVLLGRAEFVGNSGDGTFEYQRTNKYDGSIFELLDKLKKKNAELEEDNRLFTNKYLDLVDVLQDNGSYLDCEFEDNQELLKNYNKPVVAVYGQSRGVLGGGKKDWIDEVLDTFHHDDNYGFLKPDGTFCAIEYAEHEEWAIEHVKEMGWEDDYREWYRDFENRKCDGLYEDYLIYKKHYILIHNPGRGMGFPTWDDVHITKQQSEFLYDYYVERDEPEKANVWLNIEENS